MATDYTGATPMALYAQALREVTGRDDLLDAPAASREDVQLRYIALMKEHGFIVPRNPGNLPANLPCGWPHR